MRHFIKKRSHQLQRKQDKGNKGKDEKAKKTTATQTIKKRGEAPNKTNYSRNRSASKQRPPAKRQLPSSSEIRWTKVRRSVGSWLKILRFRSFQIIQETRMIQESRHFFYFPWSLARWVNQKSAMLPCPTGTKRRRPNCENRWPQICAVTAQPTMRWSIVSGEWRQKTQTPWFWRPWRCSRSAVQHRRRIASQRKILHLSSAQDLQRASLQPKRGEPMKKAL